MPCSDGGSHQDSHENKRRLDQITALLCEACKTIEDKGLKLPSGLHIWWVEHQQEDQARALDEAIKQRAVERKNREEYERLKRLFNGRWRAK